MEVEFPMKILLAVLLLAPFWLPLVLKALRERWGVIQEASRKQEDKEPPKSFPPFV